MRRKNPAGPRLSVISAIVSLILAGCGGETAIGPERQAVSAEAPATTAITANRRTPDLGSCDSLRAPTETRLVAKLHARGVQIYRWDGAAWVFVEPSARLFMGRSGQRPVGTHYAGPTWESRGGSKVVGSVMRRCTPNANAIPWLLLNSVSSEGHGIFQGVTHIQRVKTVGGLAPLQSGTFAGELSNVPYTADYMFYRAR